MAVSTFFAQPCSLPWHGLLTPQICEHLSAWCAAGGCRELVLKVWSAQQDRPCFAKGRKISAEVLFLCCPDDVDIDVFANLEQLVKDKLTWLDIHCCSDVECPQHQQGFYFTEAEPLSEGVCMLLRETHERQNVRCYLRQKYDVLLRTMPATQLPMARLFYDAAGNAFAYRPGPGAKTPKAHESDNVAGGKRKNDLPRPAFHAAFWIMAMLHEKLSEMYTQHTGRQPSQGVHALAVHWKNFAHHYTPVFTNPKFKDFVGLSENFTRVVDMDALIQGLTRFTQATMRRSMRRNVFQFKGLRAEHVDVQRLAVLTVHAAKEFLPKCAMLILLGQ